MEAVEVGPLISRIHTLILMVMVTLQTPGDIVHTGVLLAIRAILIVEVDPLTVLMVLVAVVSVVQHLHLHLHRSQFLPQPLHAIVAMSVRAPSVTHIPVAYVK